MATKKSICVFIGFSIIAVGLLGSVPQAMAETLNYKLFNHITKMEVFPLPDAQGHEVSFTVREGVNIYENGELAWVKAVATRDGTKAAWSFDQYVTITFTDGSTIVTHVKGTGKAEAAGSAATKWAGEIIHGTGRFQGIKGTQTSWGKLLPPGKEELLGKSLGEGILNFTLPSK